MLKIYIIHIKIKTIAYIETCGGVTLVEKGGGGRQQQQYSGRAGNCDIEQKFRKEVIKLYKIDEFGH